MTPEEFEFMSRTGETFASYKAIHMDDTPGNPETYWPPLAQVAMRVARELTEPGEPNGEYIRGQAELICDLFGLPMDEYRDEVIAEISKGMPHVRPHQVMTPISEDEITRLRDDASSHVDFSEDAIKPRSGREDRLWAEALWLGRTLALTDAVRILEAHKHDQ